MPSVNDHSTEHQELWHLIAWVVNGRASPADQLRLALHLRDCDSCSEELQFQQALLQAFQGESERDNGDSDTDLALQQFWRRHAEATANDSTTINATQNTPGLFSWRKKVSGWLLALAVVESLAVGALSVALWLQTTPALAPVVAEPNAPYQTLSASVSASASPVAFRVVFASGMTLAELQALLQRLQLQTVAGPSEAGVFSLALETHADPRNPEHRLTELRASPGVVFAEAVIPPATMTRPAPVTP